MVDPPPTVGAPLTIVWTELARESVSFPSPVWKDPKSEGQMVLWSSVAEASDVVNLFDIAVVEGVTSVGQAR